MSVIDDIKQRLDIVEVISGYVPDLKKAGRSFKALCPFHSEKTPSFIVSPERQAWHCFGCGTGGDIFSFVIRKEGVDFGGALRLLAEKAGISLEQKQEDTGDKELKRLYDINETAARYYHSLLLEHAVAQGAREYLKRRGITLTTIAEFQLGFSLESWNATGHYLAEQGFSLQEQMTAGLSVEKEGGTYDRFRHRLMFPIRDRKGRVAGFGARALDDSTPKYLNSPQTPVFDKGSILYGLDRAQGAIREHNLAIIVEGYTDVITAHQHRMRNVVASMGTALTERQIGVLKGLTKNFALALDADAAGDEATLRGLDSAWHVSYPLSRKRYRVQEVNIRIISMPRGKDPDDLIREDNQKWQQLVDNALPWAEFVFDTICSKLDLTNPKDKSTAVDKLAPYIVAMPDPVQQTHYRQKLADMVQVSEQTLSAALAMVRPTKVEPKAEEGKPEEPSRLIPHLRHHDPIEEYCLCLLLQHPELKKGADELLPDHFEHIENREVYVAGRDAPNLELLQQSLDPSLHEHLQHLFTTPMPPASEREREQALADCIRRLRERRLRNLKAQEEFFISETGLTGDLAELQQKGVEVTRGLREIFREGEKRKERKGEE